MMWELKIPINIENSTYAPIFSKLRMWEFTAYLTKTIRHQIIGNINIFF